MGGVKARFPELERLLLVSDSVFDYCVSSCTEVQTQIKIDAQTGSTKDGSLRYQELLPSDTALYAVVLFNSDNFDNSLQASMVSEQVKKRISRYVQVAAITPGTRTLRRAAWFSEMKKGGKS
jgi:CRISPR-associated protein Cmr4